VISLENDDSESIHHPDGYSIVQHCHSVMISLSPANAFIRANMIPNPAAKRRKVLGPMSGKFAAVCYRTLLPPEPLNGYSIEPFSSCRRHLSLF